MVLSRNPAHPHNYGKYADCTDYNYDIQVTGCTDDQRFNRYRGAEDDYYDEPPLLDELEIYPLRIVEKSLAVLNPFHVATVNEEELLDEPDLSGPFVFGIAFAAALFVTGGPSRSGYIYGLSIVAVFAMYLLIQLLSESTHNSQRKTISEIHVASILGYGMLPVVWLAVFGISLELNSWCGYILAAGAIHMAASGTSTQLSRLTGNPQHRYLLAYPCAVIYLVLAMLVVF